MSGITAKDFKLYEGEDAVYFPDTDTWSAKPKVHKDDEWDYTNVEVWKFRTGNCPHPYHTPGWVPHPRPKRIKQKGKYDDLDVPNWFSALIVIGFFLIIISN